MYNFTEITVQGITEFDRQILKGDIRHKEDE